MSDTDLIYDRHKRNRIARRFYRSSAWKRCRATKLASNPTCERCRDVIAAHVHHVEPISTPEGWARRLEQAGLRSLCVSCHNVEEGETPEAATPIGTLHVEEDERYHFDEAKADRPLRFVERFCRHYEGRFAGQPFTLLPWQRELIRTLYGWVDRSTGLRRFRELYLITAKGAGKTPMLAALGLYHLLADGEAGAHVVSMASSFEQANLTFSAGKKYIGESVELRRLSGLKVKQYVIEGPRHGKWTTISGKPNGRSGPRPSCVIADEAHEWPAATGQAFDLLCANLFKRSQPLLLVATNAGADRSSFAWQLHERACRVLDGKADDPTLLPVIFEAPRALDWRSEEAAKAANPSLGEIVSFDQLRPEQEKGEARYRRLYLSQWVTGSEKWLDLDEWDKCCGPIDPKAVEGLPLYVGLDLAIRGDLCAATFVRVSPDRFYLDGRFWVPRQTAEAFEARHGIPYAKWEKAGAIDLLDQPTIGTAGQEMIAAELIALHKRTPIAAVCYDRTYAEHCVEAIRAAGIECRPVGQGWGVSSGCGELQRRITERSITIAPNPVLRWNAENVEVKHDERGNFWPIKPNASGKYAGRVHLKIDGIQSAVTALTEARRHAFPASSKTFKGGAWIV